MSFHRLRKRYALWKDEGGTGIRQTICMPYTNYMQHSTS